VTGLQIRDVYDPAVAEELVGRIEALTAEHQPQWGTMDVARMLAHCCVPYEMALEDIHRPANPVVRTLFRLFVKPGVVNGKPYRKSVPTAPAFRIADARDFQRERERLVDYVRRVSELGAEYFDGRPSPSFGTLTAGEWNNLLYKHLDHHLRQFGV
jgi:hypothetical protein